MQEGRIAGRYYRPPMAVRADWRLGFRVFPLVGASVAAKLALNLLGWDTVTLNALHSGLLTGSVFLIGFMLAGTLADYKESEKLPGELAGRVETIADECQILHRDTRAPVARGCLEHLERLAGALNAWIRGERDVGFALEHIEKLNDYFLAFQPLTQPNFIVRLKQEQSTLRLLVIRINTIKETSFVGAGYMAVRITSLLLVISLLFADFAQIGTELFLLGAITFMFAYTIMLIRDMDDPFDYDASGKRGSVEVSLAPLEMLRERMAAEARALADGS
jgi:hypothetical protein